MDEEQQCWKKGTHLLVQGSDVMANDTNEGAMAEGWYVVKRPEGHCDIAEVIPSEDATHWGPFASQGDAIARRVGLIRSGKCQPV